MPRLLTRSTGAHAILVGVLGADLAETILLVLIGGLAGPPLAWVIRTAFFWLHTSLIADIALVLVLALFVAALISKLLDKATNATTWGCAATYSIPILSIFVILWLVKPDWIAIHADVIPVRAREPFPWPLTFVAPGAWMAFALSGLAHLLVWRGYQRAKTTRQHTFSRAHQNGDAWHTIESAYRICRRELARYDPLPFTLRTPPTFLYYTPDASMENEERMLYWNDNDLVLPTNLISTDQAKAEILLPYLARLLYDYQSPEIHQVELVFRCARLARKNAYTRFFLGLALLLARPFETKWMATYPERVLDRDRFAHWLGQGKRLRKLLKNRLERLNKQGLPDNTIPTLTERIDHLGSLIRTEGSQVKHLRETVQLSQPPSAPPA
jgi:hypothetical protein